MKNLIATAAVLTAVFATPVTHAQAVVGQAAPTFQATDVNGKTVQLSDYAGKHVASRPRRRPPNRSISQLAAAFTS